MVFLLRRWAPAAHQGVELEENCTVNVVLVEVANRYLALGVLGLQRLVGELEVLVCTVGVQRRRRDCDGDDR